MKPALPAINVPGDTPFQKMDNLFRAVIAVPKADIDKREEEWRRQKLKNGKRGPDRDLKKGPQPKPSPPPGPPGLKFAKRSSGSLKKP
jgi:hypothetical protein